jgi:Protein of unknown function (DUF3096)
MTFGIAHIQPLIALIAGILILLIPRLLNFIVAIYLIIVGIMARLNPLTTRALSVPVEAEASNSGQPVSRHDGTPRRFWHLRSPHGPSSVVRPP